MNMATKKQWAARLIYYLLAEVVLALGLTLNTKTLLGSSPIISIPYTISLMTGWNFGNLTLLFYVIFVGVQLIFNGKNRSWFDVLQIPFSIVFTRFLNLFSNIIQLPNETLLQKLLILAAAIILTGIGAAASVNMKLIPTPGDGLVSTLSMCSGKSLGAAKNIVDCCCVGVSCLIGLLCTKKPFLGVGAGTIVAMLGVGRVIALFNHFFKAGMERAAGMDNVV